eukprot:418697-Amphidinium_carterae.1
MITERTPIEHDSVRTPLSITLIQAYVPIFYHHSGVWATPTTEKPKSDYCLRKSKVASVMVIAFPFMKETVKGFHGFGLPDCGEFSNTA